MTVWTLTDRGRTLRVVKDSAGSVVVTVDERPVLERPAEPLGTVKADLGTLDGVEQTVRVELGLRRSVRRAALVERIGGARHVTPFVPPAGSRARRLYELRERHPRLFAARHVAATVVGFLGISAMISAFFARLWERIDWSWLPDLPTLTLPALSLPDWLRYLNPFYWLRSLFEWVAALLPDWDLFGWWPDWELPWLSYIVPLGIALAIAFREVDRRQARARREADYHQGASLADLAGSDVEADPIARAGRDVGSEASGDADR